MLCRNLTNSIQEVLRQNLKTVTLKINVRTQPTQFRRAERVIESMSDIAQALKMANENFVKSNIRDLGFIRPMKFMLNLINIGFPDDKLVDASKFLKANNGERLTMVRVQ